MQRSLLPIATALLVIVCLSGGPGQAAPWQRVGQTDATGAAFTISGQIVVAVPGVWDNIEVILEDETGIPSVYTHTAGTGNFSFSVTRPGRYFVVIDLNGFEKVRERVDVVVGELMLPLKIFMVPEGAKDAAAELRRKYSRKGVEEYEKAQDEIKKGDLQKAAQRLIAALKEAPTFFEAQLLLGTVYYRLRQMPEAEAAYRKAKDLDPKAPIPLMNLGQLYIETADAGAGRDAAAAAKVYQAAFDNLSEAVKLDSTSANAVFLLGFASYRLNRNDEAEANLKKALELNKRLGQAQVMLANVYLRKQNWQKALETLDAYLKDNPKATDAAAIQGTRNQVAERVKASAK
jgi:Flp pilus assembly protein TadD